MNSFLQLKSSEVYFKEARLIQDVIEQVYLGTRSLSETARSMIHNDF